MATERMTRTLPKTTITQSGTSSTAHRFFSRSRLSVEAAEAARVAEVVEVVVIVVVVAKMVDVVEE